MISKVPPAADLSLKQAPTHLLGMRVDATSYAGATQQILSWARARRSRYVCAANVHMVMECYDDPQLRQVVNEADLITPDGMPLVWSLRLLEIKGQGRVYGPTLMLHVCEAAAREGVPVGFYGGSPVALQGMIDNLVRRFPKLPIAYAHSPPFRQPTEAEDARVIEDINVSGARILFAGLGCPRQERWMAAHASRLPLVMLGVGAAFDFHSGKVKQAPGWMQASGLEWLFRLLMEPRRLWRRYAKHNPRFAVLMALQLAGLKRFEGE